MFINIKKGKIFFFDSVGHSAPQEIVKFVERITEQGKQLKRKINFVYDENHPVEHQYGNTECGIYSIFFIVHMLEDKFTEHYLKTHILKDKHMEKFRKIYYNENI
jgi:Ulp1 family protease